MEVVDHTEAVDHKEAADHTVAGQGKGAVARAVVAVGIAAAAVAVGTDSVDRRAAGASGSAVGPGKATEAVLAGAEVGAGCIRSVFEDKVSASHRMRDSEVAGLEPESRTERKMDMAAEWPDSLVA